MLSQTEKRSIMFSHRPLCLCLLLSSVLGTPYSGLSAQEVQWRTDYNLARKEALDKNRPLLLDIGTEQCFWCRRLDAITFRDAQVVLVLNEHFIPLKIDAENDARLAAALHIRSYPTLVLAAPDGKILGAMEGYREPGPLHDQLERVLAELRNPDWMTQAYQEAAKAVAAADYAHARALLQSIAEGGGNLPLQVKAKQMLSELEQQEVQLQARVRQARELLAQALADYQSQQYLCCLDRCARLAASFADLPEGIEGARLAKEITNNPEALQQACASLTDRLSELYLALAEVCIQRNQPQQAARYWELILQIHPGTPQAETARLRLSHLSGTVVVKP
jgi:thioredoxin-related protein